MILAMMVMMMTEVGKGRPVRHVVRMYLFRVQEDLLKQHVSEAQRTQPSDGTGDGDDDSPYLKKENLRTALLIPKPQNV